MTMTQHNRETLLALADRAEKATGPDREIDCAISLTLAVVPEGCRVVSYGISSQAGVVVDRVGRVHGTVDYQPFTASLDAAMSIADKPDEVIRDAVSAMGKRYALHMRFYDPAVDGPYSQALARMVCAAALRARATLDPTGEKA